jgi:hypothetical protein
LVESLNIYSPDIINNKTPAPAAKAIGNPPPPPVDDEGGVFKFDGGGTVTGGNGVGGMTTPPQVLLDFWVLVPSSTIGFAPQMSLP